MCASGKPMPEASLSASSLSSQNPLSWVLSNGGGNWKGFMPAGEKTRSHGGEVSTRRG